MRMKKLALIVPVTVMLAACAPEPAPESFYNHGDPESLIDLSTEVVSLSLSTSADIKELTQWVNDDAPSRVDLGCDGQTKLCKRAMRVLEQFDVPYATGAADTGTASLVYERIQARECDNFYVDNHSNQHNQNYSAFGCSSRVNMVQSVADRRQFVSPSLLDYHDGEKGVQAYQRYQQPPKEESGGTQSLLDNAN